MKYKVTLNGRTYEVEVEAGKAMLLDEYEAIVPHAPVFSFLSSLEEQSKVLRCEDVERSKDIRELFDTLQVSRYSKP